MTPSFLSILSFRHFVVGLLLLTLAGFSAFGWTQVDFNALGLTPSQQTQINNYENKWRQTYTKLHPEVEQDRTRLRQLINDPNADEGQVMMIQSRLQRNEERLRNEATHIFMKKKSQLNPEQKRKLQKMIGR